MKLYPHQIEAVKFHSSIPYSICGDDPGLGKTLIALTLVNDTKFKTLIVVPAFLRSNWLREIDKFYFELRPLVDVVSYNHFTKMVEQKVSVMNRYEFIIFDEAHFLKERTSKRTKAAHDVVAIVKPKKLLLLTGTPIVNRVTEFWSLLKLVHFGRQYSRFDTYEKFYTFANTFSHMDQYEIRGRRFIKYYGIKNQETLKELIRPIYLRRKTHQVVNLPEQIISFVGDESSRDLDLEKAWDQYDGSDNQKSFSAAKAVNALAKVDLTIDFVLESLVDQKLIIFSDHVLAAETIHDKLKDRVSCRLITGETPVDERAEIVKEFEAVFQILIATIGAASTGLNLQVANYMVFNDICWVPGVLEQAMKRIHRIGTTKTCFYYFVTKSKIDHLIAKTINEKRAVIGAV